MQVLERHDQTVASTVLVTLFGQASIALNMFWLSFILGLIFIILCLILQDEIESQHIFLASGSLVMYHCHLVSSLILVGHQTAEQEVVG